jgi:hypothetical protein
LIRRFVGLRSLRLDEQQGVVELDVGVAELEAVELSVVLAVGGAEEVAGSGSFDDGLRDDAAIFEARQQPFETFAGDSRQHFFCALQFFLGLLGLEVVQDQTQGRRRDSAWISTLTYSPELGAGGGFSLQGQ